jgi:hypothetical protein
LPGWAFFVRAAHGVRFDNCRIAVVGLETRQAIATKDALVGSECPPASRQAGVGCGLRYRQREPRAADAPLHRRAAPFPDQSTPWRGTTGGGRPENRPMTTRPIDPAPAPRTRLPGIVLSAIALALPCAQAAWASAEAPTEADLRCPASLAQRSDARNVPPGWIVHDAPGEQPLQGAAFYQGDPVGLGSLAPDSTHRSGQTETSTWLFGADDSARVWIGCRYRDAPAIVARPLPAGLHQCTTTLRLTSLGDPSGPVAVQCR